MVFHTEDLPAEDRFDAWYEMTHKALITTRVRTADPGSFEASARLLNAGRLQLTAETVASPLHAERSPKLIRRSDPEQYLFGLVLDGSYGAEQSDRNIGLVKGDLVLLDSSRPFRAWYDGGSHLMLWVAKALLPISSKTVEPLLAQRLSGRDGIGGLLSHCLRDVDSGASTGRYRPADASRLLGVAVGLLAALLAHELGMPDPERSEGPKEALLLRIHAFMNQHLVDPELSPGVIAAAHHISSRYLHRLFEAEGTTVAAWIRQRRLEQCHRDLADPRQSEHTIQTIAARWGLTSAAHFSRLFRATYGVSPSDHRQHTRSHRPR